MSEIKPFNALGLHSTLLTALSELGFESPSPIQAQSIPVLLAGGDLIAQAQTGTGKTAAFGLPLLQNIDLRQHSPQAIILAPTRELAIQVAEALKSYARHLDGFRVLPIYGGQDFQLQLKGLKRGAHVVVGTPGRVMDHLRRESLSLATVKFVVLDEADEMLKMGFQEDVEWILQQIPEHRQMALFSATMPPSIQKVANSYLRNPAKIHVKAKTMTAPSIEQCFMQVANSNKLEALTRYLEVEDFDAVLIFARTKNMTAELAEKIEARGYSVAAMNGDMSQGMREKVIDRLKRKSLDIVIATDVAARGLDVERISHVINYDAPYDPESYVHRIGRTGRAGRTGKSLMFINPREQYLLRDIENTTNQKITLIEPPSASSVQQKRAEKFMHKITEVLAKGQLDYHRQLVETVAYQSECSTLDIAAALASLLQRQQQAPLKDMSEAKPKRAGSGAPRQGQRARSFGDRGRSGGAGRGRDGERSAGRGRDGERSAGRGRDGERSAGRGRDGERSAGRGRDGERRTSAKAKPKFGGKPGAKKSKGRKR